MNLSFYLSLLISLIFTVMGILVLSGILLRNSFSASNEYLRIMFGSVFILYGLFRGINGYLKLRKKSADNETV